MGIISTVQKAITAVLVFTALVLVVGELLGQPLLLGYVATGSMEPTISVGDGFIAIPPALTGGVSTGDVITYEAQVLQGGGPTTHRVIGTTSEGYITQGDANSFADQDAGEPPVTDAQVHAVVLQINGEVVDIPSLGTAAVGVQQGIRSVTEAIGLGASGRIGIATSGFGVVLIVTTLIYGFLTSDTVRQTARSTRRSGMISPGLVLGGLVVVLMLPLMTSMMLPSDTTTTRLLSVDASIASSSSQIPAGESVDIPFSVENNQYVPKVVILESAGPGLEISNSTLAVSHGEEKRSVLTVTAPTETGTFARSYSEAHYIHILPVPVIKLLHAIHPLVAMVTLSLLATTPAIAVYVFFVGIRPLSLRSTSR